MAKKQDETRSSGFDPETYMSDTYNESTSTRQVPLPEDEYLGTVSKVEPPFKTQNGYVLQKVHFRVDHPELADELSRKASTVRLTLFLDFTDSGSLDFAIGKNIGLGRLREALGQNEPGEPWSPSSMEGNQAMIRVKHTPDKDDPEKIYEEVRGVSRPQ